MTDLEDQTVAVIGGSAGIGLETARPAATRTGSAMRPIRSAHLMTDTALMGATNDIDGGQQLLSNRGGSR